MREAVTPAAPPRARTSTVPQRHRMSYAEHVAARPGKAAAIQAKSATVFATWLTEVRALFLDDTTELTAGDISERTQHGVARLMPVIQHLVGTRELLGRLRHGNKTYYRLAKPEDFTSPGARTIAVPTFDGFVFREAVAKVLASGASYDVPELVRNVRHKVPQADAGLVEAVLEQLVDDDRVERFSLGSTTRYRQRPPAPKAAIA